MTNFLYNIASFEECLPQLAHLPDVELPSSIRSDLPKSSLLKMCAKELNCSIKEILIAQIKIIQKNVRKQEFIIELRHDWDARFIYELKKTQRAEFRPEDKVWIFKTHDVMKSHLNADLGDAISKSDIEYVVAFWGNKIQVFQNQY